MGNAHSEELLEKATRLGEKETAYTQQVITGVVDEDAGMGQAVDGAAGGGGDPDVAKDSKKYCWIQFVLLKKINLASFVFVMDKSYNMASTKDIILHTTQMSSFL